ncbi:MAG: glycosyltransferase [Rhodospirillales bacterium]|nr:glycosyltransferase [Rhodospirillales bacterium]
MRTSITTRSRWDRSGTAGIFCSQKSLGLDRGDQRQQNQDRIYAAFYNLWKNGFDGELVLIGRVWGKSGDGWLNEAYRQPRFRHLDHVPDQALKDELRNARATIYVSAVEGFGLPPIESLHAGIPVIVTDNIPSITDLPEYGQIRLKSASVPDITEAVRVTADNQACFRLWQQADNLKLATWRDFAFRAAAWVQA